MVTRCALNNNSTNPKPVENLCSRASRVCLFDSQRERALCANGYAAELGRSGSCKRANSNDKEVLRAEWISSRRNFFVHDLCDEGAPSDGFPLLLEVFECDLFILHVHPYALHLAG